MTYKKFDSNYPNIPRMNLNAYEFSFENFFDPLENEKYVFEALELDCYAFIFIYDITKKESFTNLQPFIKILDFKKYPALKVIFVGNKLDLAEKPTISKEEVTKKVYKEIKSEYHGNLSFFEISLLEKTNCDDLFKLIYSNLYEKDKDIVFKYIQEARNQAISAPDELNLPEIRLSLFGDTDVGKTALVTRLMDDEFEGDTMSTIGQNFKIKFMKIKEVPTKFYIWDTAGQERFRNALPKTLFVNADGILLIIDVCQPNVEKIVELWIKEISNKVSIANESNPKGKVILYLIGNKIDIVKEIFKEDKKYERVLERKNVEEIAKKYGVKYFETSVKLNINVTDVIYRIASDCFERLPEERRKVLKKGEKRKRENCCGGEKNKNKTKV